MAGPGLTFNEFDRVSSRGMALLLFFCMSLLVPLEYIFEESVVP